MRRQLASLCLFLLLPAVAVAQQHRFQQVRDSLSLVSEVPGLRKREVALRRGPQAREAATLMERGLVLLRLYELTGENEDGDEARKAFERMVERDPASGWAHFGLGLALVGGPGVRVPSPGGVLDGFVLGQSLAEIARLDPRSRASRQFQRALELDPTLSPAAVELASLALISRNRDMLRKSEEALQRFVADGTASNQVTTALARVQSALGDLAGAEATAATAAAGEGGASALLAQAEALLRQPGKADAGAQAYFEGLARVEANEIDAYFRDVRVVASERELADWANAGLAARRGLLTHFWDVRAAASGKTVAERLAEHYRRLAEAQLRYRRLGQRGGSPGGSLLQQKYDAEQLPFDERGIIYLRHGEPERVIRTSNPDLRAHESWVYTQPDGKPQLFHFVVLRDGTDYRLVDDILQAMDPSSQEFPYDGVIHMLEDRAPYDARYNILATRFNSIRNTKSAASVANVIGAPGSAGEMMNSATSMMQTIAQTRQAMATENREAAFLALATDSDRPVFDSPLPFYYDVYTFKGTGNQTDVTAAIAIPGTSLEPRLVDNTMVYALQLSLMVIDTLSGSVTRRDTVFHLRSDHHLTQGEHLRLHTDVSAAASKSTIHRLVIRDLGKLGRGQMYGGSTSVPAYDAAGLMMSDIVLAEPDRGAWHRGEADLALVPPRQFQEGQPLTLFYELYNLPAATPYSTEIVLSPTAGSTGFGKIKKLFGGSDGTVRLRFDGAADLNNASHVQEVRRITTELKQGKYRVQIRVTSLANQQVTTATKEFVVVGK